MSLGKNIYKLRTSKNLSQGDLAELLDVSRQSISKWETDSAIPDLDKLIKICDVFELTLDELTDRAQCKNSDSKTVTHIGTPSTLTHAKIVGYILLATTLISSTLLFVLSEDIEDAFILLPVLFSMLICSIICLCVNKHVGYWCTWAAISPIYILSFSILGLPIFTTIGINQILIYIIMAIIARKKFKDCKIQTTKTKSTLLAIGFIVAVIANISVMLFVPFEWLSMCFINYIIYSVFAVLLTYGTCYIGNLNNK